MKEIRIIGGGLAGLSLGIALRQAGVPVTLYEVGDYPRHRVCGEFVCGVDEESLSRLGIDDIFHDAPTLHSASWWLRGNRILDRTLPIPATGLSRYALDQRLATRFQKIGGKLLTGERFRTDTPREPGLVWANGRKPAKTGLLGLKMHVRNLEPLSDVEMHFAPGGYAGVSIIENDEVNVCALFRQDPSIRAPREQLFVAYLRHCGLHGLADRLEDAETDPESHAAISSLPEGYASRPGKKTPCAIGDAFGMMGPFTGNGLSMAMESAAVAAPYLERYARGDSGWETTVFRILDAESGRFGRRLNVSKTLHKLLLNPVGLSGIALLSRGRLLPFRALFHQLR